MTTRTTPATATTVQAPSAAIARPAVPVLAGLTLFALSLCAASFVPPSEDEFYHWCWAERLQLSYYDHPVMTALLVRAGTLLFGDTIFAVRFFACAASAFTFGVIVHLTRPRRLLPWVALCPLFTVGSVLMTPDTPLLLFWSAYVWWLVTAHRQLTPNSGVPGRVQAWHWVLGGVLLGCGVLGKYTMALAGLGGLLAFVLAGRPRGWFAGWVLHGFVGVAVASPILIYNLRTDFAPLRFQWNHSMETIEPSFVKFLEFVGIQAALFGTLPLVLLPWAVWNGRRFAADPLTRVCLAMYAFPLAFFLYKATRGPLEGNWALASFVAFWPLAEVWYAARRDRRRWRILGPASFAVPVLASVAVAVHLVVPLPFLPAKTDRITRQTVKVDVAKRLKAAVDAGEPGLPVYCDSYQMTAMLRFHGIDARQIDGATRPSHFTQTPERPTDVPRCYVVWDRELPAECLAGLEFVRYAAVEPVVVRGEVLAYYKLTEFRRVPGSAQPAQLPPPIVPPQAR